MGFEELFENNRKENMNYGGSRYPDDSRNSNNTRYPHHENEEKENWQNILEKIKNNRKLRVIVIWAGIILSAIAIVLIIALFPLIVKLINYIAQNGLQGVINTIEGFIGKILNGTSN
jgi:hypothetical protein